MTQRKVDPFALIRELLRESIHAGTDVHQNVISKVAEAFRLDATELEETSRKVLEDLRLEVGAGVGAANLFGYYLYGVQLLGHIAGVTDFREHRLLLKLLSALSSLTDLRNKSLRQIFGELRDRVLVADGRSEAIGAETKMDTETAALVLLVALLAAAAIAAHMRKSSRAQEVSVASTPVLASPNSRCVVVAAVSITGESVMDRMPSDGVATREWLTALSEHVRFVACLDPKNAHSLGIDQDSAAVPSEYDYLIVTFAEGVRPGALTKDAASFSRQQAFLELASRKVTLKGRRSNKAIEGRGFFGY